MPSSRRLIPQPPKVAGNAWENINVQLDAWMRRLADQLNDGIPAGFNNITPQPTGTVGSPGTEVTGWTAADHIHKQGIVTTKGDLLGHSDVPARVAVGANNLVLVADSAQPTGVKWGPAEAAHVVLAPPSITSNQNNYAPGVADVYYLTSDANRSITGFTAGTDGEFRYFINVGAFQLTLEHEDTGSSAANRFVGPGAFKLILDPGDMAFLVYDGPRARWRAYELVGGLFAAAAEAAWENFWWPPHFPQAAG